MCPLTNLNNYQLEANLNSIHSINVLFKLLLIIIKQISDIIVLHLQIFQEFFKHKHINNVIKTITVLISLNIQSMFTILLSHFFSYFRKNF